MVNDRGPFIDGRLIDLSRGAAKALRLNGLGRVEVEALD
ncbi:rare lipoprotein A [Methylococcus capsulatus]|uniref:Rare lipoprotein A n=1 Tax=Methylococcus capsulatus TaxID=414 RepID=A0AA35UUP9_METCP|nr:rare lipoprotein A [Methylococcus capsulatus]